MSLNIYTTPGINPVGASRLKVTDTPIPDLAASTMTVSDVIKGLWTSLADGLTQNTILTLPTAAILISSQALNGVQEGDCYPIIIVNGDTTRTVQLLAGTGGSLNAVGIYTLPLSTTRWYYIIITDVTPGSENYEVHDVTTIANV